MASTPDSHPDSLPPARSDDIERVSPDGGRDGGETPPDSPGTPGGTAGTGGDNKVQEDLER